MENKKNETEVGANIIIPFAAFFIGIGVIILAYMTANTSFIEDDIGDTYLPLVIIFQLVFGFGFLAAGLAIFSVLIKEKE